LNTLQRMAAVAEERGLTCVVIGGFAVIEHGYPRLLQLRYRMDAATEKPPHLRSDKSSGSIPDNPRSSPATRLPASPVGAQVARLEAGEIAPVLKRLRGRDSTCPAQSS
jgi:hypothetical protein